MENTEIIYGIHPVEEIFHSNKKIIKLLIKKSSKLNPRISKIISLGQMRNIGIQYISREDMEKYIPEGVHQGIIAFIIKENKKQEVDYSGNLYIILDHITDVHNAGAIFRSAEFFKTDGVILPKQRSVEINETVNKTSAGAISHLPVTHVSNITYEIEKFKKNNFWIIGADVQGDKNLYEFEFPQKSIIVLGNEEKGISRLVKDNLDFKINVPGFGHTQSLNVSVAAALFLFQYRKFWRPPHKSPSG